MCVVSMVSDHYQEKWIREWPQIIPSPVPNRQTQTIFVQPAINREEFDALKRDVEELKALLKRAKEYDERTGQPDCEMDEKIAFVRKMAEMVGVDLNDVLGSA